MTTPANNAPVRPARAWMEPLAAAALVAVGVVLTALATTHALTLP